MAVEPFPKITRSIGNSATSAFHKLFLNSAGDI